MSKHNIILTKKSKSVKGTVHLTGSKSECNRALIIEALSDGKVKVENISDAADTATLLQVLSLKSKVLSEEVEDLGLRTQDLRLVNIGPAGTAMRFLTAYFTLQDEEVVLTGSERMKQRPIGILVDALRELGAHIDYVENDGFPPIKIKGSLKQRTSCISIKGNISSQYITALLLIAARLPLGLELQIEGELTSRPYVEMTLAMLQSAGIQHRWDGNVISTPHQEFAETSLHIEPDWSAASYWYAVAALADEAELFLPRLTQYSLQGDSVITEIMANFGITSQFKDGGVYLQKEAKPLSRKIFDLKECPDLAQTIIVVCAALGHDATFTGLETLKIKETDRIKALQNELAKIGVKLIEKGQVYKLDCSGKQIPGKVFINTYDDHRMAMAFAPLALIIPELEIEDADVVEKSYPAFWKDLEGVGFGEEISFVEHLLPSNSYEVRSGGQIKQIEKSKVLVIPNIRIDNNTLSPNQLSEGTFKALALIYYIINDTSDLLLIEEPEVCVHHGLLKSIMELIVYESHRKQIFISTHSDSILDRLTPENVILVKKERKFGTKAKAIPETLSKNDYEALKNYLETTGTLGEYWKDGGLYHD